ncbi:hypothetical protein BT63DRAFT_475812 [Microthyrium microscopicum]|uniref:Uncharacterized protein n=1 Tax=Microthyrium microscopicum TaxID=703497 RepID=A0A6A6UM10_9PEZI|nr:hypothetical protein BT63DRAFT_475812 [Microthyrium microscopicum]
MPQKPYHPILATPAPNDSSPTVTNFSRSTSTSSSSHTPLHTPASSPSRNRTMSARTSTPETEPKRVHTVIRIGRVLEKIYNNDYEPECLFVGLIVVSFNTWSWFFSLPSTAILAGDHLAFRTLLFTAVTIGITVGMLACVPVLVIFAWFCMLSIGELASGWVTTATEASYKYLYERPRIRKCQNCGCKCDKCS